MSKQQSVLQALAASGAVLIIFIGVCHEVVGARLFPWAPALFGAVVWHTLGLASVVIGIGLLGGVLRLISFPVFSMSLVIAVLAMGVMLFTAIVYREFHLFALTDSLAGAGIAIFHRKAAASAGAELDLHNSS